ncbi:hypothetical protein JTE90_003864 [Oedothorax gibbosus]|uniref:Uncharacterized protein n=1 Tax=Oedothorax gibbosus TaxID=931172 RepID=A0AAV6UH30_9ARAC|nr:hypothetical protein JTE90_003864 [Oedothorax gibbosus]
MQKYFLPSILTVVLTLATVQSAPPKFESDFDTKVFVEGSKAWTLCSATNDSPIKYKWFDKQRDEVTSSNDVYTIRDTAERSRLIFEKVTKSQEGIYTCTAENGLVTKLFRITVNSDAESENFTIEDVHVLNVTDSSVQFLVRASKSIGSYNVKYFEKMDTASVKTLQLPNGVDILIEDLIPSGLYTFQFQVLSSEGVLSNWSEPIEVVLLPYSPEMIIRGLSDNTLRVGWSKKWNDFSRETIDGYLLSYGYIQRESYDKFKAPSCMINIELQGACSYTSYTIADLFSKSYYEIQLKAHTKAGYGKPTVTKIYVV